MYMVRRIDFKIFYVIINLLKIGGIMNKLSEYDLLKSQKIIDSLDVEKILKNAMSVEEWIVHNDKLRENYKQRKGNID